MNEGLCMHMFLTIDPGGKPGSQTAADSRPMSRSCNCAALGLRLRSPACSMWRVGSLVLRSKRSTFPKQRTNCITIRQSPKQPSGNRRPGNRDSSGSAYGRKRGEKKLFINLYQYGYNHPKYVQIHSFVLIHSLRCTVIVLLKKLISNYFKIQLTNVVV